MVQTTFTVPDITCDHCDRTITNALQPVAGVERVSVDISTKRVQLDYDPDRVNLDQIKTILEEEYYPVASVAPSNQPMSSNQSVIKGNVPVADTLNTTAIDPVCGMSVDTQTARYSASYGGQAYYFCSPGCMRTFEKDPARHLTASEEPAGGCSCCSSDA